MANRTFEPEETGEGAGERLDPRLAAQIAELPRELPPSRDLWPGIAARLPISARPAAAPAPPSPLFFRRPAFWRQALAATLSAAIGAALTWFAIGGRAAERYVPPASAGEVVPAAFEEVQPDDYRLIEADYLRAKESLWLAVYARSERLSPDTLAAIEKSFAAMDRAIDDLRQALERDPGNRKLAAELYRSHRRGLDLLRRLAKLA